MKSTKEVSAELSTIAEDIKGIANDILYNKFDLKMSKDLERKMLLVMTWLKVQEYDFVKRNLLKHD